MNYYTVDEVATITGIKKRTIKYYVEREIIKPSAEKNEGKKKYWLYTDKDISKLKQIALYKELNYSADDIKKIISDPSYDRKKALDNQISELRNKKKHIENLIFAAEMMRYFSETESSTDATSFDISDFDNDIDDFADNMFIQDEDELTKGSLEKVSEDIANGLDISDIKEHGQAIINLMINLQKYLNQDPSSKEVQNSIGSVFSYLASITGNSKIEPSDVLFGLRLVSNISIDRIFDVIFSSEEFMDFLLNALKIYCEKEKES